MTQSTTDIEPRSASGSVLGSLLIGVCGSSCATSAALLIEEALTYTPDVTVVATPTACNLFLSEKLPVTVYTDTDWADVPLHVKLLEGTDTFIVAPTTATTFAKAVSGMADTLVTALILAHGPGIYFQPCMNAWMWNSPSMRRTIGTLRGDGHFVLEPPPNTSRASRDLGSGVGAVPGTVMPDVAAHKLGTQQAQR
ncbi:flavoprotein [Amycolatopsis sp. cg5]|uniref:flavoprotein n=1 Tax=Amycolatopsis sp. cg5 TaxID=3238802 RepID=UPI003525B941